MGVAMIDEQKLRELCSNATPGPWVAISRGQYWGEEEGDVDAVNGPEIVGAEFVEPLNNQQTTRGHCWYRDAAFIAAANPVTITALLDELATLRSERTAWRVTAENAEKNAARYRWLAWYLPSDEENLDDAIVSANSKQELDAVIDAAIDAAKETP